MVAVSTAVPVLPPTLLSSLVITTVGTSVSMTISTVVGATALLLPSASEKTPTGISIVAFPQNQFAV